MELRACRLYISTVLYVTHRNRDHFQKRISMNTTRTNIAGGNTLRLPYSDDVYMISNLAIFKYYSKHVYYYNNGRTLNHVL